MPAHPLDPSPDNPSPDNHGPGDEVLSGSTLTPSEAEAVRRLAARAATADGVAPLSEQSLLHLDDAADDAADDAVDGTGPDGAAGVTHLLVTGAQGLAGYAQIDRASAELVVDPSARRQGIGSRLLAALERPELQIWAHGDTAAARGLAHRAGYERGRVLLQLRRPLSGELPDPAWTPGVRARTFRPGQDEAAWLAVNNAAFASHPEQGGWTLHDVQQREQTDWFDPAGVFLAERDGELLGFHWTKVHRDVTPPIGEVYIVGVRPQDAGQGLGRALTLAGLHHLRAAGLDDVLLYVDEDNVAAVKTYERLGFTRYATDVQYVRRS